MQGRAVGADACPPCFQTCKSVDSFLCVKSQDALDTWIVPSSPFGNYRRFVRINVLQLVKREDVGFGHFITVK